MAGEATLRPVRVDVNQALVVATLIFQKHPQVGHLDSPSEIGVALGSARHVKPTPLIGVAQR